MLSMKMEEYVEETKEVFNSNYCSENTVLCWNRTLGRNGVLQRREDYKTLGRKYEKETKHHQEELDYWLSHMDEYIKLHKHSFEVGDMDINNPIRKELTKYVLKIQLFEDGQLIDEDKYYYGR